MSSTTVWDQVLGRIESQVGQYTFSTWFKPTSMLADLGKVLKIRVPSPLFVEWLPKLRPALRYTVYVATLYLILLFGNFGGSDFIYFQF